MPGERSNWWSAIVELGSVPGSPEEVRAFLQHRIKIFVTTIFFIWALALILDLLVGFATLPAVFAAELRRSTFRGHLICISAVGVLTLALRMRRHSVAVLSGVDVALVLLLASFLAWIITEVPLHFRPEIFMILGTTHILVLRAAVLPSAPLRTAILGVLAFVPIVLATAAAYFRGPVPVTGIPPGAYAGIAAIWAFIACVLTTLVSRVLFGLHDEVRRARRLGQYTLGDKIGEGGMGSVYLAQHSLLRRPTAIKLLARERAGTSALARFEREVQITSRLTHPNTVAIYDYGHTPDGTFYYAMEYLEGLDLERLVESSGPLPAGRVVHLLRQAAGSLAEAHRHGLIHRDVKPSNLVVCERGLVADFLKVVDFGLVRDEKADEPALTQAGSFAGSPLYMSPEQIVNPADVDGRGDLYSLAAVGYFLLAGSPPFEGKTMVEVCGHHLHTRPSPPSSRIGRPLPAKLEKLLLLCLEKDRARRPVDARAFVAALDACDDVEAWSAADAERWWREHPPPSVEQVTRARLSGSDTLTVDVASRGLAPASTDGSA
jgi:serine/threonine-protein kinase